MSPVASPPLADQDEEIATLIATLYRTGKRLEELTGGEVDAVAAPEGGALLLPRAQDQLRHREAAKQAAILNALPAHIALLDAHGVVQSVNEAWQRFSGAGAASPAESAVGLNYLDICDRTRGEDSAEAHAVAAGIRSVLGGWEKTFSIEYACHSPEENRWFLLSVSPLAGDTRGGVVVMHLDITARKRVDNELVELSRRTEQHERILNTALSSMSDFAQIFDRHGRLLFANEPFLKTVGRSLDAVVGLTSLDLGYPDELAQRFQRQLREVFDTRRGLTDEADFTGPGGHGVCYEYILSPVFGVDGAVELVVAATRDITPRKLAEAETRFNEQRYRSVVEATTAIVWDTPASGEFEKEQPAWSAFTGQTFAELRGWGWLNAVHPDDRPETSRIWSAAQADRSTYEVEHRLMGADRSWHHMVVRAVPIFREDGELRQWIGVHTDVTGRKKLEQQFLRAQRLESIGTIAGGIAHDLNNTLGPIILSIELLKLKFADYASQELLSIISSSAQRGADMVRQVLSFARGVEGRRIEVQVGRVLGDVGKIVNDTFFKHIELRILCAPDLRPILGEPTQIHQVLLNLCVNARDAMPDGGSLTIRAENLDLDAQHARLDLEAKPGPYIAIKVEDNGTGMTPETIEKIFDPFFTTKELGKGTGLGLSTSLAIVRSHGGFVRVDSWPGQGTTFAVYLPALTIAPSDPLAVKPDTMPRGSGELILVVDDEPSIRKITQRALEAFGYRVLLASGGAEAVALYTTRGAEIAVVLTDMMMPGMDGPAVIAVLRSLDPAVRVIVTSGLSTAGDVSDGAATSLGTKYLLPKPYATELLLTTLKQVLEE